MKHFKIVLLLVCSIAFLACNSYGEKLTYDKTEVYYTNKVDKADAEKLGDFLVRSEFAGGNEKSIQLTKNDEGNTYIFRMVTNKEAVNSKTYEAIFKIYAKQISDSVFNKQPVDFHICDNTFKTLKELPFEKEDSK